MQCFALSSRSVRNDEDLTEETYSPSDIDQLFASSTPPSGEEAASKQRPRPLRRNPVGLPARVDGRGGRVTEPLPL